MFPDEIAARLTLQRVGRVQVVWSVVAMVVWIAAMAVVSADQDYTSGELLNQLLEWTHGEPLYSNPAVAPYRVMNYPPLALVAARVFSGFGASPLVAGRLVGTLGVLLALAVVYRWLRDDGVEAWLARAVVALAGASFPLMYSAGQFHLEGLAVAGTLTGVRYAARNTRRRDAILAGVFLALACFVKQTQAMSSVAVLLWMACCNRRALWPALVAFALVGITGLSAIVALFGSEAWRHLTTYTVGTYSLQNLAFQLVSHGLPWMPLAVLTWYASLDRPERIRDIRCWYLVATTCLLVTAARLGSGFPYFIEWELAILVTLGPLLQRWLQTFGTGAFVVNGISARATVALFCSWVVGSNIVIDAVLYHNWHQARETEAAFARLCPLAPPAPAFTVTENVGAARACGIRAVSHPFIIASLAERGLWNEEAFVRDIEGARYGALLLPFNPADGAQGAHAERWSPRVQRAMRRAYHPLQFEHGWWLLAPVRGAPRG